MVNIGPTDYHHFFQIPVTQGESALHINEQHNHRGRKAETFKMMNQ
jgi:hypothetical protein